MRQFNTSSKNPLTQSLTSVASSNNQEPVTFRSKSPLSGSTVQYSQEKLNQQYSLPLPLVNSDSKEDKQAKIRKSKLNFKTLLALRTSNPNYSLPVPLNKSQSSSTNQSLAYIPSSTVIDRKGSGLSEDPENKLTRTISNVFPSSKQDLFQRSQSSYVSPTDYSKGDSSNPFKERVQEERMATLSVNPKYELEALKTAYYSVPTTDTTVNNESRASSNSYFNGTTSSYLQNEPQKIPSFSRTTINETRISKTQSQPTPANNNLNYETPKPTDFLASIIRQTLGEKERAKSPFGEDYNTNIIENLGANDNDSLAQNERKTLYETEISKMASYAGNYSSLYADNEPLKNYVLLESRNTFSKVDALKHQDYNIPVSKSAIYEPETFKTTNIGNSSIYPKDEVKDLHTRSSTLNTQTQKEQDEPLKQLYIDNLRFSKHTQPLKTKTFLEQKRDQTFESTGELPNRQYLIKSINNSLAKSFDKEKLLTIPGKILKRKDSELSPAKIEVQQYIKEKYEDGSVYEGEAQNGVRHGKGIISYSDGIVFRGEFNQGKIQGQGALYYRDGNICYQGSYFDEKFEGKGVLFNENPTALREPFNYRDFNLVSNYWLKYDGEFNNDMKNGKGTLYLMNGERFYGEFVGDNIHGKGTFYVIDGHAITGTWENNVLRQTY